MEVTQVGKMTDKTYIIAEIGINHMGSMDKAKALIDAAVRSGVDAVKFQTYITEKRAPKGNTQVYDILKKCELPFNNFKTLKHYTERHYNIDFFSTPFDEESVDLLYNMGLRKHKIASFDVTNHDLLRYIGKHADDVIMSTGMSSILEIERACKVLEETNTNISLLHCVSSYPTDLTDANINAIKTLQNLWPNYTIGQSDHTPGIKVPLYSVVCGAKIIEKHFMIEEDCVDAPVSINEKMMTELVSEVRLLENIMGDGDLGMTKSQENAKIFRRHGR